jgi:hypothetical protein
MFVIQLMIYTGFGVRYREITLDFQGGQEDSKQNSQINNKSLIELSSHNPRGTFTIII